MSIKISDAEFDALDQMPHLAQIIYFRCLRRYMNFRSRITGGPARRISLDWLSEVGTHVANRKIIRPTQKSVRVALAQLERAGLLARVACPEGRYLIFSLPLALGEDSGKTGARQVHANQGATQAANFAACVEDLGTTEARPGHAGQGTLQETGKACVDAEFEKFFAVYPKKTQRHAALAAWRALAPDAALIEKIAVAVAAQSAAPGWQVEGGRYIPSPAAWLTGRRWEDQISKQHGSKNAKNSISCEKFSAIDELAKFVAELGAA